MSWRILAFFPATTRFIRGRGSPRANFGARLPDNGAWNGLFGVIAQMGERYNGIVEVRGSIPRGSTTQGPACHAGPFLLLRTFRRAEFPARILGKRLSWTR